MNMYDIPGSASTPSYARAVAVGWKLLHRRIVAIAVGSALLALRVLPLLVFSLCVSLAVSLQILLAHF